MKRLLSDEVVTVQATPDAIWATFADAATLARVLPGCRDLVQDEPSRFHGVLAAKLAFITVEADVQAAIEDQDPPRALRLAVRGRPRGLAGSFQASIPVRLEASGASTRATYDVDLEVSGRLATFGAPLLREAMRRQVGELVTNLEREGGTAAGGATRA